MDRKPPIGAKVRMLPKFWEIKAEYNGHYVIDNRYDKFNPLSLHTIVSHDNKGLLNQVQISDGENSGGGFSYCPIEWFELVEESAPTLKQPKPVKPTKAEEALKEAEARVGGLRELVDLEAKIKANKTEAKALDARHKELTAKLFGGKKGKP